MAATGDEEGVLHPVAGEGRVEVLVVRECEIIGPARQPVKLVAGVLDLPQLRVYGRGVSPHARAEREDVVEGAGERYRGRRGVAAPHGEPGYRPGGTVGDGPVMALDVGYDVVDEAPDVTVGVVGIVAVERLLFEHEGLGGLLAGIAVGHDADHGNGEVLLDEVVQYLAGAAHGAPRVLVAAGAVQQVEHGIVLAAGVVTVRGVDEHPALQADGRGVVPNPAQVTALGGLEVVFRELAGNEEDAHIAVAVPLGEDVVGVVDRQPVDDEVVGVDLGSGPLDADGPHAEAVPHHVDGRVAAGHP